MSILDTLVDATAALFRQLFGQPGAPAPASDVPSAPPADPARADHETLPAPPDATPAVPEAPAGAAPTGWLSAGWVLTSDEIQTIMPNCSASRLLSYYPYLLSAMAEFSVTSKLRAAAFLAQGAHESGELRYMEEIASGAAYEGRADLGNTEPGDGVRYKGRGMFQLTGRANYRRCGAALGLDLEGDPAQAATPQVGFRIAGWYWTTHGCNELADGGTEAAFIVITRRINGGLTGLASREAYYARAKEVLGV
jgi:putative chitinase